MLAIPAPGMYICDQESRMPRTPTATCSLLLLLLPI
jgi:hypothetical protein